MICLLQARDPRKTGSIVVRTEGLMICMPWSRAEDQCSNSNSQAEQVKFSLPPFFCSFGALNRTHWREQSTLLSTTT